MKNKEDEKTIIQEKWSSIPNADAESVCDADKDAGSLVRPPKLVNKEYCFDAFFNGLVLENKKTGRLPAMGWNSWNAFGSNNTERLTMTMADKMVALGLDQLGYQYIVLDDGCYLPERVDGKLANEPVKFPHDFKVLSDYIHAKGLKFGMYNDIGTNLCAGAAVGTCGHEETDAKSYVDWDVDFLKVDNCYYLWDNATFSDAKNAKYVYAPRIKKITLQGAGVKEIQPFQPETMSCVTKQNATGESSRNCDETFIREHKLWEVQECENDFAKDMLASDRKMDGVHSVLTENGAELVLSEEYFSAIFGENGIGTYDGTGPERTPVGLQSRELVILVETDRAGTYELLIDAVCSEDVGCGSWLQVKTETTDSDSDSNNCPYSYDDFFNGAPLKIHLAQGTNKIRLMNHRRQENTLQSYGKLLAALNKAKPDHDILLSICEWGKTQPQNWGYKVGDSWRILNDITFRVGNDGNPGYGAWNSDYTAGVTAQYNKAVIMDEFAGLDKGWNDPDMLMIGMNGLDMTMNRTHMTMWCMLNAPLMLGLDLRRVQKGDELYQIIANEDMIALNQDPLGIQARRICVYSYEKDASIATTTWEEQNAVISDVCEKKMASLPELCEKQKSVLSDDICAPRRYTDYAHTHAYLRDNNRVDVLLKPFADGCVAVSFINLSEECKENLCIELLEICTELRKVCDFHDVKSFFPILEKYRQEQTKVIVKTKNLWTEDVSEHHNGRIEVNKLRPHEQVTFKIFDNLEVKQ